jgi:coenzyme F420 hydrogenase subunit beta
MPNVDCVVKQSLCTSCGICAGACPRKCISFEYGKKRNVPVVDKEKCNQCGLCYRVCPGKGIELCAKGKDLFGQEENVNWNKYCGYWKNSYVGHASDESVRFHSASGGMITSFLLYLLKKKIIDGALVVRYKENEPFTPEPFIATTEKDLLSSKGSKYLVCSYDKVIDDLKKFEGKLVVVGLPCQIQGLRNFFASNKKVRDKIVGCFSIYCSLNKIKQSMDYYLYRYGVKREDVKYFSFRDDGCLGFMKFVNGNGETIKRVPYESFWMGSHSFFVNDRCMVCADHFGELADISFGDINIAPYNEDKIGINSLVTRSSYWDALLHKCQKDGWIEITPVPIDDVLASQKYAKFHKKGSGILANFRIRKFMRKANPKYDVEFEGCASIKKIVVEFTKVVMRKIGSMPFLWWLVKLCDRNKD